MTAGVEQLRALLEARNVRAFLTAFQEYRRTNEVDPVITGLTQRVFPPVLRDALQSDAIDAADIVLLWRLVRSGSLLLVENDLLMAINERIDFAIKMVEPATTLPVPPLVTFNDVKASAAPQRRGMPGPGYGVGSVPVTEVKRVAIASAFSFGVWSSVDAFDFRKNLCASQQEFAFLRAIRQFFPSLQAYPNQPLRNFIDIEKLKATLPARVRNFAWSAQVDVLLCTADEDPVVGIELDSVHHDGEAAAERDALKNGLFNLAGVPLVRIRAVDTKAVREEDFYDLLSAQAKILDALRPRRLRPRRAHDCLVPAEVVTR